MATRTQKLGVEGIVVDGQVRDIEYIRSLNLPVHRPSYASTFAANQILRLLQGESLS